VAKLNWRTGCFLLLLPQHQVGAQHVGCSTNYYAVTGANLREIHQSFRQARPWRATGGHDGFTVWNVSWRFSTTHNGSVCRLATFSTTTTINITLPRWIAPTNATDSLKSEWAHYIDALGKHEYGHAQSALGAAAEMQKRIKEINEDPSCENLKQRLNALCQTIVQKYKQTDEAYDQRTDHGRNDGARLGRRPVK
jgi:predicted secreted Zn-dependent protease